MLVKLTTVFISATTNSAELKGEKMITSNLEKFGSLLKYSSGTVYPQQG